MTVYTMETLKLLVAGKGSRSVQECTQNRNIPLPDFRVDIRRDIYSAVIKANRPMTRAEIAKAVGRKKTTWLTERIEACVADGLLTRSQSYWKNGVVMYFYAAADRREL